MPDYDRDIRIIKNHIQKLPKTKPGMYDFEIEWVAYMQQAANEILERVMLESMKLPEYICGNYQQPTEEIIEDYISEMSYYRELADSLRTKRMFTIKLGEAETIGCLFV